MFIGDCDPMLLRVRLSVCIADATGVVLWDAEAQPGAAAWRCTAGFGQRLRLTTSGTARAVGKGTGQLC